MQKYNIKDFKYGWMVGDFEPSLFRNPFFELAHHFHEAGCSTYPHYHKVTTEMNYIVRGAMMVSGVRLETGDIWIYEPHDLSDVEFLEDTDLVILRWPSIPSDKYMVEP
jgi:hypothetical protein